MIDIVTAVVAAGLTGLGTGMLFGYHKGLASTEGLDTDAEDLTIMGAMYEAAIARANELERRLDAAVNLNNEHRKAEHDQANQTKPRTRKPYIST
jgi:hypothetical protein